jgi:hypothetical protein
VISNLGPKEARTDEDSGQRHLRSVIADGGSHRLSIAI